MDIETLTAENKAQAEEILTLNQALMIRGQEDIRLRIRIGELEASLQKMGSGEIMAQMARLEESLRITQLQLGGARMDAARVEAGGAPVADIRSAALTALLTRIDDANESYERHGAICQFEGNPMIYAATLEEIIALRGEFHVADGVSRPPPKVQGAAVPEASKNLVERAARIAESYCACDDEEDGKAINFILRNRGAQIRSMLGSAATVAPVEPSAEPNKQTDLSQEVARLQNALYFWLPSVTDREDEVACRILEDAFLLVGCDGNMPEDFKSAQELGWVALIDQRPHQAAPVVLTESNLHWQQSSALLYVLRHGTNDYEVSVTMAAGSRSDGQRADFAAKLLSILTAQSGKEQPGGGV